MNGSPIAREWHRISGWSLSMGKFPSPQEEERFSRENEKGNLDPYIIPPFVLGSGSVRPPRAIEPSREVMDGNGVTTTRETERIRVEYRKNSKREWRRGVNEKPAITHVDFLPLGDVAHEPGEPQQAYQGEQLGQAEDA